MTNTAPTRPQDRPYSALLETLKNMVIIAGYDYDTFDFKDTTWYSKNTMTKEQHERFKYWFFGRCSDPKFRRAIGRNPKNTLKWIRQVFTEIDLNYGLKVKDYD